MLGRPEGDVGTHLRDELKPPQDPREVFRGKLGRVHADRSPSLLRTRGEALGRCGPASTLTGALSHLRTCVEASGNCGPTSMLTGAPEQPQDPRGGFRNLWARIHADRSP